MNSTLDHEQFLSAILKHPSDQGLILAYADWLEEHGDERAAYLRYQVESGTTPTPSTRKNLIESYPHRHIPWVAKLEQAGAVDANLTENEFAWWGTGIGPAREAGGTYEQFRYEDQPPLPVELFDGSFDWLKGSEPEGRSQAGPLWKSFCKDARSRGFFVPEAFERFMTDEDLSTRIKSCTDNIFTEPSNDETLELTEGLFVTFYADSQYCVIWGLLLPRDPGRYAPVMSGVPEVFFPAAYELEEDEVGDMPAPVLAASHLESFLYRWWIENEIWFATQWEETQRPLTPPEQAYLDHLSEANAD